MAVASSFDQPARPGDTAPRAADTRRLWRHGRSRHAARAAATRECDSEARSIDRPGALDRCNHMRDNSGGSETERGMRRSPMRPAFAVALALLAGPTDALAADTVVGPRASQWLVELKAPPGADGTSKAALDAEHRRFREEAEDAGVHYRQRFAYSTLFNGVSISAPQASGGQDRPPRRRRGRLPGGDDAARRAPRGVRPRPHVRAHDDRRRHRAEPARLHRPRRSRRGDRLRDRL